MSQNLVHCFARLDLNGLFRYMPVLILYVLHCLIEYLLHIPMLPPLDVEILPQLRDNFISHRLFKRLITALIIHLRLMIVDYLKVPVSPPADRLLSCDTTT